ncbi:Lipase [Ceratobasidium sp. AG-Ba]|nr:Lipase [Ceratobasidium sp. AG-Ba]
MRFAVASLALALSLRALAAPVERDTSTTPINAATISSYSPYASFAAAAYCSGTANWSCTACKRIPGFVTCATGGDGNGIPFCRLSRLKPLCSSIT